MHNTLIDDLRIDTQSFSATITVKTTSSASDFARWYVSNKSIIDDALNTKGSILVQGLALNSVEDFENFTSQISIKFRNYLDGSYPRRRLSGHVYISTEYDSNYHITLHNELSYSVKWPSRLFFGCIVPAQSGGETPLADSREILRKLDKSLVDEFKSKQVRYVRNLHGGEGMGPSWKETFITEDPKQVEQHCQEIGIEYEWKADGGLKLVHVRPATRMHPVTGEEVWFNQADQFHPSHFRREVYETLMMLADGDEENLPLYASFGDGTKIPESVITEIQNVSTALALYRPWQKGDFVIIDNMLVCHGRAPYQGHRQIVVSMA